MARMHTRKKGASRSHRPLNSETPKWITHSPKEVEMLVVKLAKNGSSSAIIGATLRDSYGIPSVSKVTGKSITAIRQEHKLASQLPEDLVALIKKSIRVRKHLEMNKMDKFSTRGLHLIESKVGRLIKYYKDSGKLAPDWKYDPEQAALYLE